MKIEEKSKGKIIECAAFLDNSGKIYVPLRHRKRLGLEGTQCDVELIAEIKTIFDKKGEQYDG